MRTLLLCIGVCLALSIASAQTGKLALQSLVSSTAQRLEKGAKVSFSSQLFDAKGTQIQSTQGTLYTLGKKFRLRYSPIDANYDGRVFSYYDANERTFTIMNPSTEDLAMLNPFVFFSSSPSVYRVQELAGSKTARIVAFTPKKKMNNILKFEVSFSHKTNAPSQIVGIFADGMRLVMSIASLEDYKPSSQMFIQKQTSYPNSELVDLR